MYSTVNFFFNNKITKLYNLEKTNLPHIFSKTAFYKKKKLIYTTLYYNLPVITEHYLLRKINL